MFNFRCPGYRQKFPDLRYILHMEIMEDNNFGNIIRPPISLTWNSQLQGGGGGGVEAEILVHYMCTYLPILAMESNWQCSHPTVSCTHDCSHVILVCHM